MATSGGQDSKSDNATKFLKKFNVKCIAMYSGSHRVLLVAAVSLAVLIFAYVYQKRNESLEKQRLQVTLDSLLKIEEQIEIDPNTRIAIGYGACVDYFVNSSSVVIDAFEPPDHIEHHFSIYTREEFLAVFAYFFKHGAAAERYINNASLFEELLQLVKNDGNMKMSIGGNAPLMAVRFSKEGVENVLLGSQMSDSLKQFLPLKVTVSGPVTKSDEIHLLLEYPAGATWGDNLVSPRANRFIVHNDASNSLLSSLEIFHNDVRKFNPQLFVVGGIQMMDNYPDLNDERKERLLKVKSFLSELTSEHDIRVHFEMASFSDEKLLKNVVDYILPYVDSIGMNEQELPNLYQMQAFGNVTLVSDAYPRVATVLDQIRDLYSLLYDAHKGKISRIHVHTLAFQAILVRSQSSWKNTRAAAAKAALTAHRHTCGSDVIDVAKAKLIMDESFTTTRNSEMTKRRIVFNETQPVACWKEDVFTDKHPVEICVAPVMVCTKVRQTGGGGDNVSAAGLVVQVP